MPAGDGRGPNGMGPMSGRGMGYCAGNTAPGYTTARGGGGFGPGRGRGRGWSNAGFGRGQGFVNRQPVYGYQPEYRPEDEARALKDQARYMQREMEAINERIEELEKLSKQNSHES
jgi:hypothetical protein